MNDNVLYLAGGIAFAVLVWLVVWAVNVYARGLGL